MSAVSISGEEHSFCLMSIYGIFGMYGIYDIFGTSDISGSSDISGVSHVYITYESLVMISLVKIRF